MKKNCKGKQLFQIKNKVTSIIITQINCTPQVSIVTPTVQGAMDPNKCGTGLVTPSLQHMATSSSYQSCCLIRMLT